MQDFNFLTHFSGFELGPIHMIPTTPISDDHSCNMMSIVSSTSLYTMVGQIMGQRAQDSYPLVTLHSLMGLLM